MGGNGRFAGVTEEQPTPMAELEGTWNVRRLGGFLPPLAGVTV